MVRHDARALLGAPSNKHILPGLHEMRRLSPQTTLQEQEALMKALISKYNTVICKKCLTRTLHQHPGYWCNVQAMEDPAMLGGYRMNYKQMW